MLDVPPLAPRLPLKQGGGYGGRGRGYGGGGAGGNPQFGAGAFTAQENRQVADYSSAVIRSLQARRADEKPCADDAGESRFTARRPRATGG